MSVVVQAYDSSKNAGNINYCCDLVLGTVPTNTQPVTTAAATTTTTEATTTIPTTTTTTKATTTKPATITTNGELQPMISSSLGWQTIAVSFISSSSSSLN